MAINKAKIMAAIARHDEALQDLEILRKETRTQLALLEKRLNAVFREIALQDESHEGPQGIFASDPVGDLLVDLRENYAPSYDEIEELANKDAWSAHLSLEDQREKIAALKKKLANR